MLIYYVKQALFLTLVIAGPVVVVTAVMGLVLGFMQAIFQLQDQAMPFALKLVAVVFVLIALGPWMASTLIEYTDQIFRLISHNTTRT
jgi:type III secretion protein S